MPTPADKRCVDEYYNFISRNITNEERTSFLGYAPVLEAISAHISSTANKAKLISDLTNQTDCVAIIMNITWDKLKLNSKEQVSVMNIKLDPNKIKSLIDNKVFFECYHTNQKHWISIALTNKLDLNEIEKLIEESYNLTC